MVTGQQSGSSAEGPTVGGTLHLQRAPDHLEEIYTTGAGMPPLPLREGNMEPFTQEELQQALSKGKPGKAVGVNQTSHELMQGLGGPSAASCLSQRPLRRPVGVLRLEHGSHGSDSEGDGAG